VAGLIGDNLESSVDHDLSPCTSPVFRTLSG
jgi:hypothetical protein